MNVRIHAYSRIREIEGLDGLAVEVGEEATVSSLLERLYRDFPALEKWDAHLLVAVGLEWADRSQSLRAGDEISLMPPVQGG